MSWSLPAFAQARAPVPGPLLTDELKAIARGGVRLIYSSQVVPPDLRTRGAPPSGTVAEKLRSLLAPLHLEARPLTGGGYVIVRTRRAPARAPPAVPAGADALERIVVQTSRYQETASPGVRVGRTTLESSPETHGDALRALQAVPGTAVAGYTARTHVRGSRDDEVLYRYDGVTLDDPYHVDALYGLFSPIDPSAVDSVTAWTGVAPIEFGGEIGGVVDITPRRITATTVDLEASEQGVNGLAGTTFGHGRGEVFADLRSQNEYSPVGWIATKIAAPSFHDLIAHVRWAVDARTLLTAGFLGSIDQHKYFEAGGGQDLDTSGAQYYVWLRLAHEFSGGWRNLVLASVDNAHQAVSGDASQRGVLSGSVYGNTRHSLYAVREEAEGALARGVFLRLGMEETAVHVVDQNSGFVEFFPPFIPALQTTERISLDGNARADAATNALYANVRWRPRADTILDVGLRRDQRKVYGYSQDSQWNARFNLWRRLSAATALRVGWGQESQADLLYPIGTVDQTFPPPVRRLTQTNLSIDHELAGGFAVRAEIYDKREASPLSVSTYAFSPFALVPELAVDQLTVTTRRARMDGFELSLASDRTRALSGSVSYVWSRAADLIGGQWTPRAWDQPQSLNIHALWRRGPWSVAGTVSWHSGWPYTPLLASSTTWTDPKSVTISLAPLNSARLGAYFSIDARLAWRHRLGGGLFEAYVNIYDLNDSQIACCTSYAVLRDASGTYNLTESRSPWLKLTPVAGFRWHF